MTFQCFCVGEVGRQHCIGRFCLLSPSLAARAVPNPFSIAAESLVFSQGCSEHQGRFKYSDCPYITQKACAFSSTRSWITTGGSTDASPGNYTLPLIDLLLLFCKVRSTLLVLLAVVLSPIRRDITGILDIPNVIFTLRLPFVCIPSIAHFHP
jgi:hypothetical protein